MKLKIPHIIAFTLLLMFAGSCSVKKNTWTSRSFHALNTRYNVFFNGEISYDEGLTKIADANQEDYSAIIPMYPISKHENANAAKGNMDRTIEKCRKAIKLHSIKKKPNRDIKKWKDAEYQLWYNQEEFNPMLSNAWMLLAQAEFHKGDFIGSVGTFTYISRHYVNDKDLIARCQLWIARAYGEMGWIYEAEDVLSKLKQDDLKSKHIGLFASVNADLLLKKRQYKDAIPFLELTLKKEKDKIQKQRFNFLLAQLYMRTGSNKEAYDAFTRVIKLNPLYEMEFNARIYRAELDINNVASVRKELNKMIKNSNNKDYLDQLYYVLGKTYLQQKDTVKAIEHFYQSADKSTRNGFDKAVTLITLGDIFYQKKNYIKAQPCYDEASKIITVDNEDYARVAKRAETLGELVVQNEIVVLQDSLLHLSSLSEREKLVIIETLIKKLIADEKAAEEAERTKKQAIDDQMDLRTLVPLGAAVGSTGDWYFYNPNLMRVGQSEYQKKWGRRKLEDNWRRSNKVSTIFADENIDATRDTSNVLDSVEVGQGKSSLITDNKKPEFYLQQIPATPAQIENSKAEIATALFKMGMIYMDRVEDLPMAIKTFDEFAHRFPDDERLVEAYFQSYMIESKSGHAARANIYKNKLIKEFPDSKYVEMLLYPDYFERMNRMYKEQDSLYSQTYMAYNASDFPTVKKNVEYIRKNYPLCTLMPKFLFLNALSIGKTEKPEIFEVALNGVVEKFPESDVSAMSKDILALIKQGKEAKAGTSHGTLLSRREEESAKDINSISEIADRQFSTEKVSKHRLLLITDTSTVKMNKLLFNIAAFNFTRFMVKDFDFVQSKLDSTHNMLSITNFESYDETEWYINAIEKDTSLVSNFKNLNVKKVIISEDNFGLLRIKFTLDDYLIFAAKYLATIKKKSDLENPKPESLAMKGDINDKKSTTTGSSLFGTDVQGKYENVPLFKDLFAYMPNESHQVAIVVLSGSFDFNKLKAAFDAYNANNYGMLNLKLSQGKVGNMQVVLIGSFADANVAKSYLLRTVKENILFEVLKGTDYRNMLGTSRNLNVMLQQNAISTYFEFMQEYYLK